MKPNEQKSLNSVNTFSVGFEVVETLPREMAQITASTNPSVASASGQTVIRGRYYRTDSRITGVRSGAHLPTSLRVHHVSHEEFGGVATLEYDEERRDHVLTKVEAVPGVREVGFRNAKALTSLPHK